MEVARDLVGGGVAHQADHFARAHTLADFDAGAEFLQVGVAREHAVAMVDDELVAEIVPVGLFLHGACGGGVDVHGVSAVIVDALVVAEAARAEAGGEAGRFHRRGGERDLAGGNDEGRVARHLQVCVRVRTVRDRHAGADRHGGGEHVLRGLLRFRRWRLRRLGFWRWWTNRFAGRAGGDNQRETQRYRVEWFQFHHRIAPLNQGPDPTPKREAGQLFRELTKVLPK